MSHEQSEIEILRGRLQRATTRAPFAVQNGSIQLTRAWLVDQKKAVKLLNKKTRSLLS